MRTCRLTSAALLCLTTALAAHMVAADPAAATPVREAAVDAPGGPTIKIRMQGPYDAEVPLQVVCDFKHKVEGDTTKGAPVELDNRLVGAIAALRDRGEFAGDEQETLLLVPPKGAIKAERLLLVGVGDEASLSLGTMERVGRTALREASRLGVKRVAFAPLLRDQGNDALAVGDVEAAVVRGMLLAYDTQKRLQEQGLTGAYTLEEWIVEAGPAFFDDTVEGAEQGIGEAGQATAARPAAPYAAAATQK